MRTASQLPGVVVCESRGAWSAALRSSAELAALPLVEVRTLGQCEDVLRAAPASFVVLELEAAKITLQLGWLAAAAHRFGRARLAVVMSPELAVCAELARELGAVAAVVQRRHVGEVARLAARFLPAATGQAEGWLGDFEVRLPWHGGSEKD